MAGLGLKDLIQKRRGELENVVSKTSSVDTKSGTNTDKGILENEPVVPVVHSNTEHNVDIRNGTGIGNVDSGVGERNNNGIGSGNIKLNLGLKKKLVVPTVPVVKAPPQMQQEDFNHPAMIQQFAPKDVEGFRETIKILHDCFDHPEMVGNATRNILISCRENPEFLQLLLPEDYQLMIRALRTNHGLVVSSKVAGKAKKANKAAEVDRMVEMLGDIELDIG